MDSAPDFWSVEIERARAGDVMASLGILREILRELQYSPKSPLWEPLRLYLIDALREIVSPEPLKQFLREQHDQEADRTGKDPLTTIRMLLDETRRREEGIIEHMGDANRAFNLKKRRGNNIRSRDIFSLEAGVLHWQLRSAMEAGKSYEEAVYDVAESEGVSESTVRRAWEWRDQFHANKGEVLAHLVASGLRGGKDLDQVIRDVSQEIGVSVREVRKAWTHWSKEIDSPNSPDSVRVKSQ
jgi:hypothetical protein